MNYKRESVCKELSSGNSIGAADPGWFGLDELQPLSFEHDQILQQALQTLRHRFVLNSKTGIITG